MGLKERRSIILRKYAEKVWTPDNEEWPLVLQREHPLTPLEVRVLETLERRKALTSRPPMAVITRQEPVKREARKPRKSKGRKKSKASDGSWDEVVYDGKSIMIGDERV